MADAPDPTKLHAVPPQPVHDPDDAPVDVEALRAKNKPWPEKLRGIGTVTVRRVDDLISLALAGIIPLHLLGAIEVLQGKRKEIEAHPETMLDVPPTQTGAVLELLRRYACQAIVTPKFVIEEDPNKPEPGTLPIQMLDLQHLMQIWRSTPPPPSLVPAAAATRFREGFVPVPADAGRDGAAVRPEAVVVAGESADVISQ